MKPLLSYIVVRTDLPMSQVVVQASHAAMEMGIDLGGSVAYLPSSMSSISPKDDPIHLAVLGVDNEKALMKVVEALQKAEVEYTLFDEPDDNMGYTALCTYPSTERSNILSKLKLL